MPSIRCSNRDSGDDEKNNSRLHDILPKQSAIKWEFTKLVSSQALTNSKTSVWHCYISGCFVCLRFYRVSANDSVHFARSD